MPDLSRYRFTSSHEWVRREGAEAVIGITEFAASQLGDVIFVELPAIGTELAIGERFGVIESVKAASDLYAPVAGVVEAVNGALVESPETVNGDPYEAGWMLRLRDVNEGGATLIDESSYTTLVEGEH